MKTTNNRTGVETRGIPPDLSATDIAWDPHTVRQLIEAAAARGEEPGILCLGQREAKALEEYLSSIFDDERVCLRAVTYADLKVVVLSARSCLRVCSPASIRRNTRHAMEGINDRARRDAYRTLYFSEKGTESRWRFHL